MRILRKNMALKSGFHPQKRILSCTKKFHLRERGLKQQTADVSTRMSTVARICKNHVASHEQHPGRSFEQIESDESILCLTTRLTSGARGFDMLQVESFQAPHLLLYSFSPRVHVFNQGLIHAYFCHTSIQKMNNDSGGFWKAKPDVLGFIADLMPGGMTTPSWNQHLGLLRHWQVFHASSATEGHPTPTTSAQFLI